MTATCISVVSSTAPISGRLEKTPNWTRSNLSERAERARPISVRQMVPKTMVRQVRASTWEAGATPRIKIGTSAAVGFVGNVSIHGYLIDAN